MPVEWVKVGTNVLVGGGVGAGDQLIQNWDRDRAEKKAPEKLGIMAQAGTYYNYGIPILAILGTAFGFLKGEWATRLITAGSTLAGRKVTYQVTKPEGALPYTRWTHNRALEAQRQAEARRLAEARARAKGEGGIPQVGGEISPIGIPVITNETVLV